LASFSSVADKDVLVQPPTVTQSGILLDVPSTSAFADLALASLLMRVPGEYQHAVRIYIPRPTVAFSTRDLRSPGIAAARERAASAGYTPLVRSAGGQIVAYDAGSVIVDHITRTHATQVASPSAFSVQAELHAAVLREKFGVDARVGALPGEYCPGEFSVNIGGLTKAVGSAQRIAGVGSLFSTVFQVEVSRELRHLITAISEILGYDVEPSTIGGLADHAPTATATAVAACLRDYYRRLLPARPGPLPLEAQRLLAALAGELDDEFDVDLWVRQWMRHRSRLGP